MKIPGLPYQRITIESPLTIEQFQEMLKTNTIEKQPWLKDISNNYKFVGKISNHSFKLVPTTKGRNTYLPWIIGSYKSQTGGCSINVIFTLHPVAIILMLFFLIFTQYLSFSSGNGFHIEYASAIIIFHFVLDYIGFLPETKRVEEFIRNGKTL